MNKTREKFAALALPALLAASCGGDGFFGTLDGGSGACPAGITVHRISTGTYAATAGSGAILNDGCMAGLMAVDVEQMRQVQNDAQGNITLLSADGLTILGAGPVRCNTATLTYGPNPPVYRDDGTCRYAVSNSVDFTVTSDSAFDIVVTQTRSDSTSDTGMTCKQPTPSCTVKYKVSQHL